MDKNNKYTQTQITSLLTESREVICDLINEDKNRVQLNKELVKVLSEKFGTKFGRFLTRRLSKNKVIKNVDLINLLKRYEEKPTEELYENIFVILSEPLVDYFISRTIGFRNDIAKITPFKKAVGTGNFKIDYTLYKIINEFMDRPDFMLLLSKNLKDFIDDKLEELFKDPEYDEIQKKARSTLTESRLTDLWRKWSGQERRSRVKLLSDIYKIIPKVNKKVKKQIREEIFLTKFSKILTLKGNLDSETIASIIAKPIVENFISQMAGSNILKKTQELEPFYVVILKSLNDKRIIKMFREELEEIVKQELIKKRK